MSIMRTMPTLVALYCIDLSSYALQPLHQNKSAVRLAVENACLLPFCEKILILAKKENEEKIKNELVDISCTHPIEVKGMGAMTAFNILQECGKEKATFSDVFIAPLEAPFIDTKETCKLYERHSKYKAEYTFAEGYPDSLFPQILSSSLCTILASFVKEDSSSIKRDFIFNIIKKDINSYDIETLVAPEDARILKLNFLVNSKRSFMLCKAFLDINAKNYIEKLKDDPLKLKTLPRYYMIEVMPHIPFSPIYKPLSIEKKEMKLQDLSTIIEKISAFSDDAIISLSLYGDPLESDSFIDMAKIVLQHKNLSLLVETHGIAQDAKEKIEAIHKIARKEPIRPESTPALYWITFIDATTPKTYAKVYNTSENDAENLLKRAYESAEYVASLFKNDAFVQIVRMKENEDELEGFFRSWKERGMQVIIQKYDHFCTFLPDRRVANLAPLKRMPCRHIGREICISSNGDVLLCKEDVQKNNIIGNILSEDLEEIYSRFDEKLLMQAKLKFGGLCELCDEYYTYNF